MINEFTFATRKRFFPTRHNTLPTCITNQVKPFPTDVLYFTTIGFFMIYDRASFCNIFWGSAVFHWKEALHTITVKVEKNTYLEETVAQLPPNTSQENRGCWKASVYARRHTTI
jgi:hypothetical protein